MSYNHPIPDVPIALSMLPEVETPTENDILYLVQPNNQIGQRSRSISLKKLNNSGLVSPEKVVVSSAPDSGDWLVDLGSLKETNRLVLVQNSSFPKTLCGISLSGTQPSSTSLLDIVVVYGSWTGNLTLSGLSAGNYTLHGADGEWMRGVIGADGRLAQYSIMGHFFNKSSQGFSGESGVDEFSIGTDGISLINQDSNQNYKEFSVDFDGSNWNVETEGKLEGGVLQSGSFRVDNDTMRMITTSGAYTELMTPYDTISEPPYGFGYMRTVVNVSSGSVEVRFLDVSGNDPSSYRVINLNVGECALLFCTGVHLCSDNKYRNDWASVAS